ncbi:hypothetical protein RHMOL_Rhmol03G0247000 [Rhododendron molle]|uniref:Uncharacterized protein n=1 Tax=Rhododendron molle TaxID=49168 RepID=A0ACC0PJK7_RHOML|nr:hypothetical protein RHMOL_Rhmol03G0247000 [Rhododendron molle]
MEELRITKKFWRVHYDATDEKIRLNYRKLSLMWYPDGHNGDNAVTAKSQKINEAYSGNHCTVVFDKHVLHHECDVNISGLSSYSFLLNNLLSLPTRN